jgi:unsaturated rhamnogalacturonyl hydrolase
MEPLEVARQLFEHYEQIAEIKHYYGLLAIYGLCMTGRFSGRAETVKRAIQILSSFPDRVAHPHYNFPSYRIGGIPRAYMLYTGDMANDATRDLVMQYATEMMTAPRDDQGILCLPGHPSHSLIWIDVAMAATPFLLFSGLALKKPSMVEEAVLQATRMYQVFLDPKTGLLFQSRGFIGPGQYSSDHWSRGNGWGILALTELVDHLPPDSKHVSEVRRLLADHLNALLPFQGPRGLWFQHVSAPDDPRNWEESSGSALFLYALGTALRHKVLTSPAAFAAFHRGIDALLAHCINPDFSTERCCHGCLAPGEGTLRGTPEAYMTLCSPVHDEPHSFGPLMFALVASHRLREP